MRSGVLLAAMLVGCGGEPDVGDSGEDWVRDHVTLVQAPRAVGDPLWVEADGSKGENGKTVDSYEIAVAAPVVEDADGQPIPVVPVDWHGTRVGYEPEGGWLPGWYQVSAAEGQQPVRNPEAFTVGPWGSGVVDAQTVVGTTWKVTNGWTAPADLTALGLDLADVYLEVRSVEADGVLFVVLADVGSGPCVVLADLGEWQGSSLRWQRDTLTVAADPDPLWMEDLALAVHFDPSTPEEASAQVRALADADTLEQLLIVDPDPGVVCETTGAFGIDCVPCTDDRTCIGSAGYALVLEQVAPLEGTFPTCGIRPFEQPEIPPLSCEIDLDPIDCGCDGTRAQQGAIPAWIAVLTVLGRRRRRSSPPRGRTTA